MPNRDAIERGFSFEDRVADVLNLKKQPGSGNKFYAQSDCAGHGLMVSCKSEKQLTYGKIHKHLQEAESMAYQTDNIPILALDVLETESFGMPNEEIVIMRLSDFAKALEEVKIPEHHDSKGLEKRSTAEVPIMLRL